MANNIDVNVHIIDDGSGNNYSDTASIHASEGTRRGTAGALTRMAKTKDPQEVAEAKVASINETRDALVQRMSTSAVDYVRNQNNNVNLPYDQLSKAIQQETEARIRFVHELNGQIEAIGSFVEKSGLSNINLPNYLRTQGEEQAKIHEDKLAEQTRQKAPKDPKVVHEEAYDSYMKELEQNIANSSSKRKKSAAKRRVSDTFDKMSPDAIIGENVVGEVDYKNRTYKTINGVNEEETKNLSSEQYARLTAANKAKKDFAKSHPEFAPKETQAIPKKSGTPVKEPSLAPKAGINYEDVSYDITSKDISNIKQALGFKTTSSRPRKIKTAGAKTIETLWQEMGYSGGAGQTSGFAEASATGQNIIDTLNKPELRTPENIRTMVESVPRQVEMRAKIDQGIKNKTELEAPEKGGSGIYSKGTYGAFLPEDSTSVVPAGVQLGVASPQLTDTIKEIREATKTNPEISKAWEKVKGARGRTGVWADNKGGFQLSQIEKLTTELEGIDGGQEYIDKLTSGVEDAYLASKNSPRAKTSKILDQFARRMHSAPDYIPQDEEEAADIAAWGSEGKPLDYFHNAPLNRNLRKKIDKPLTRKDENSKEGPHSGFSDAVKEARKLKGAQVEFDGSPGYGGRNDDEETDENQSGYEEDDEAKEVTQAKIRKAIAKDETTYGKQLRKTISNPAKIIDSLSENTEQMSLEDQLISYFDSIEAGLTPPVEKGQKNTVSLNGRDIMMGPSGAKLVYNETEAQTNAREDAKSASQEKQLQNPTLDSSFDARDRVNVGREAVIGALQQEIKKRVAGGEEIDSPKIKELGGAIVGLKKSMNPEDADNPALLQQKAAQNFASLLSEASVIDYEFANRAEEGGPSVEEQFEDFKTLNPKGYQRYLKSKEVRSSYDEELKRLSKLKKNKNKTPEEISKTALRNTMQNLSENEDIHEFDALLNEEAPVYNENGKLIRGSSSIGRAYDELYHQITPGTKSKEKKLWDPNKPNVRELTEEEQMTLSAKQKFLLGTGTGSAATIIGKYDAEAEQQKEEAAKQYAEDTERKIAEKKYGTEEEDPFTRSKKEELAHIKASLKKNRTKIKQAENKLLRAFGLEPMEGGILDSATEYNETDEQKSIRKRIIGGRKGIASLVKDYPEIMGESYEDVKNLFNLWGERGDLKTTKENLKADLGLDTKKAESPKKNKKAERAEKYKEEANRIKQIREDAKEYDNNKKIEGEISEALKLPEEETTSSPKKDSTSTPKKDSTSGSKEESTSSTKEESTSGTKKESKATRAKSRKRKSKENTAKDEKASDANDKKEEAEGQEEPKKEEETSQSDNAKKIPEYSDAVAHGADRIKKLEKIRKAGIGKDSPLASYSLLRTNKEAWERIKAQDFFGDIEDPSKRFKAIEDVRTDVSQKKLADLGMSSNKELYAHLDTIIGAKGGSFKLKDRDLGWNYFSTTDTNGHFDKKVGPKTFKTYAAFEDMRDLNVDSVSKIFEDLTKLGFKGGLKTTTGMTGLGDVNSLSDTDQMVIHGATQKDQEIAYNYLRNSGLNLSHLSAGFDVKERDPDTGKMRSKSFSELLASDEIGKYVNLTNTDSNPSSNNASGEQTNPSPQKESGDSETDNTNKQISPTEKAPLTPPPSQQPQQSQSQPNEPQGSISMLDGESKALDDINQKWGRHNNLIQDAINKEKIKKKVADELAGSLKSEAGALSEAENDKNKGAEATTAPKQAEELKEENKPETKNPSSEKTATKKRRTSTPAKKTGKTASSTFPVAFDKTADFDETHEYLKLDRTGVTTETRSDSSSTKFTGEIAPFTGSGKNILHPEIVSKFDKLVEQGQEVTAESMGMTEEDFKSFQSKHMATLSGNLGHKSIEITNKLAHTSNDDEGRKAKMALYDEANNYRDKQEKAMRALGATDEDIEAVKTRATNATANEIKAYDALLGKGQTPQYNELTLGQNIGGQDIAITLDQLHFGENDEATIIDNKFKGAIGAKDVLQVGGLQVNALKSYAQAAKDYKNFKAGKIDNLNHLDESMLGFLGNTENADLVDKLAGLDPSKISAYINQVDEEGNVHNFKLDTKGLTSEKMQEMHEKVESGGAMTEEDQKALVASRVLPFGYQSGPFPKAQTDAKTEATKDREINKLLQEKLNLLNQINEAERLGVSITEQQKNAMLASTNEALTKKGEQLGMSQEEMDAIYEEYAGSIMGTHQTEKATATTKARQQKQLSKDTLDSYKEMKQAELDMMKAEAQTKNKNLGEQERIAATEKYEATIGQYEQKTQTYAGFAKQARKILPEDEQAKLQKQMDDISGKYAIMGKQVQMETFQQKGFFKQLGLGFKQSLRNLMDYQLAYQILGKIRQGFQQVIQTAKDMDTALVNLQIATNSTRAQAEDLMKSYFGVAEAMGRTAKEVSEAANNWLRAGYRGKDTADLAQASMALSTLGMIDSAQATKYLTSQMKGWKLSVDEVMGSVDKLTALDSNAAISAGDLAEAMSRANVSAQMAGSSYNNFASYVTTVADVTQKSTSSIGEAFKTLYARYGNVKLGKWNPKEEDRNGEDFNEADYDSLNDIEKALTKAGIAYRSGTKEIKNFDEVINEIGSKWQSMDQVTQNAIASAMGGVRQRENINALFENWDKVQQYIKVAENASGTASQKMEAYNDSVAASAQKVTNAFQQWVANGTKIAEVIKKVNQLLEGLAKNIKLIAPIAGLIGLFKVAPSIYGGLARFGYRMQATPSFRMGAIKEKFLSQDQRALQYQENLNKEKPSTSREVIQRATSTIEKLITAIDDNTSAQTGEKVERQTEKEEIQQVSEARLQELAAIREGAQVRVTEYEGMLSELNLETEKLTTEGLAQQKIIEEAEQRSINNSLLVKSGEISQEEYAARQAENEEIILAAENRLKEINMQQKELLARKEAISEELTEAKGSLASANADYEEAAASRNAANADKTKLGAGGAFLGGAATIGGTIVGGLGGNAIGSAIAEDSASGAMYGSMLGSMLPLLLGMINPVLGLAAGAVIGIIGGIFAWTESRAKKTQENIKKLTEEIESNQLKMADIDNNSFKQRFAELSRGTDSLGRNLSLSEADYLEYQEMLEKLVAINPTAIRGYDKEGKVLVERNNLLEESIALLEQENKQKKLALYADSEYWAQVEEFHQKIYNKKNGQTDLTIEEQDAIGREENFNYNGSHGYVVLDGKAYATIDSDSLYNEGSLTDDKTGLTKSESTGKYYVYNERKDKTGTYTLGEAYFEVETDAAGNPIKNEDGTWKKKTISADNQTVEMRDTVQADIAARERMAQNEKLSVAALQEYRRMLADMATTLVGYDDLNDEQQNIVTKVASSMTLGENVDTADAARRAKANLQKLISTLNSNGDIPGLTVPVDIGEINIEGLTKTKITLNDLMELDGKLTVEQSEKVRKQMVDSILEEYKNQPPTVALDLLVALDLIPVDEKGNPLVGVTKNENNGKLELTESPDSYSSKNHDLYKHLKEQGVTTQELDSFKKTLTQDELEWLNENIWAKDRKPEDIKGLYEKYAEKSEDSPKKAYNTAGIKKIKDDLTSLGEAVKQFRQDGYVDTESLEKLQTLSEDLGISTKDLNDAFRDENGMFKLTDANVSKFIEKVVDADVAAKNLTLTEINQKDAEFKSAGISGYKAKALEAVAEGFYTVDENGKRVEKTLTDEERAMYDAAQSAGVLKTAEGKVQAGIDALNTIGGTNAVKDYFEIAEKAGKSVLDVIKDILTMLGIEGFGEGIVDPIMAEARHALNSIPQTTTDGTWSKTLSDYYKKWLEANPEYAKEKDKYTIEWFQRAMTIGNQAEMGKFDFLKEKTDTTTDVDELIYGEEEAAEKRRSLAKSQRQLSRKQEDLDKKIKEDRLELFKDEVEAIDLLIKSNEALNAVYEAQASLLSSKDFSGRMGALAQKNQLTQENLEYYQQQWDMIMAYEPETPEGMQWKADTLESINNAFIEAKKSMAEARKEAEQLRFEMIKTAMDNDLDYLDRELAIIQRRLNNMVSDDTWIDFDSIFGTTLLPNLNDISTASPYSVDLEQETKNIETIKELKLKAAKQVAAEEAKLRQRELEDAREGIEDLQISIDKLTKELGGGTSNTPKTPPTNNTPPTENEQNQQDPSKENNNNTPQKEPDLTPKNIKVSYTLPTDDEVAKAKTTITKQMETMSSGIDKINILLPVTSESGDSVESLTKKSVEKVEEVLRNSRGDLNAAVVVALSDVVTTIDTISSNISSSLTGAFTSRSVLNGIDTLKDKLKKLYGSGHDEGPLSKIKTYLEEINKLSGIKFDVDKWNSQLTAIADDLEKIKAKLQVSSNGSATNGRGGTGPSFYGTGRSGGTSKDTSPYEVPRGAVVVLKWTDAHYADYKKAHPGAANYGHIGFSDGQGGFISLVGTNKIGYWSLEGLANGNYSNYAPGFAWGWVDGNTLNKDNADKLISQATSGKVGGIGGQCLGWVNSVYNSAFLTNSERYGWATATMGHWTPYYYDGTPDSAEQAKTKMLIGETYEDEIIGYKDGRTEVVNRPTVRNRKDVDYVIGVEDTKKISHRSGHLPNNSSGKYDLMYKYLGQAAALFGVPPEVMLAIFDEESDFAQNSDSWTPNGSSALGIGQITSGTATSIFANSVVGPILKELGITRDQVYSRGDPFANEDQLKAQILGAAAVLRAKYEENGQDWTKATVKYYGADVDGYKGRVLGTAQSNEFMSQAEKILNGEYGVVEGIRGISSQLSELDKTLNARTGNSEHGKAYYVQKALKERGGDLGTYGVNGDGLDNDAGAKTKYAWGVITGGRLEDWNLNTVFDEFLKNGWIQLEGDDVNLSTEKVSVDAEGTADIEGTTDNRSKFEKWLENKNFNHINKEGTVTTLRNNYTAQELKDLLKVTSSFSGIPENERFRKTYEAQARLSTQQIYTLREDIEELSKQAQEENDPDILYDIYDKMKELNDKVTSAEDSLNQAITQYGEQLVKIFEKETGFIVSAINNSNYAINRLTSQVSQLSLPFGKTGLLALKASEYSGQSTSQRQAVEAARSEKVEEGRRIADQLGLLGLTDASGAKVTAGEFLGMVDKTGEINKTLLARYKTYTDSLIAAYEGKENEQDIINSVNQLYASLTGYSSMVKKEVEALDAQEQATINAIEAIRDLYNAAEEIHTAVRDWDINRLVSIADYEISMLDAVSQYQDTNLGKLTAATFKGEALSDKYQAVTRGLEDDNNELQKAQNEIAKYDINPGDFIDEITGNIDQRALNDFIAKKGYNTESAAAIKANLDYQAKLYQSYTEGQKNLVSIQQEIIANRQQELKIAAEMMNVEIKQDEVKLSILQGFNDWTNKFTSYRNDIKKELRSAKQMSQYLDANTRNQVFNEADYTFLLKTVDKLEAQMKEEYDNYKREIEALTEDTLWKEEFITETYKERLELVQKEYDIANAKVNLEKQQLKLNNVLNEKNVRMLINGEWRYVANPNDVNQAQQEYDDALSEKQAKDKELLDAQEEFERSEDLRNKRMKRKDLEERATKSEDLGKEFSDAIVKNLGKSSDWEDTRKTISKQTSSVRDIARYMKNRGQFDKDYVDDSRVYGDAINAKAPKTFDKLIESTDIWDIIEELRKTSPHTNEWNVALTKYKTAYDQLTTRGALYDEYGGNTEKVKAYLESKGIYEFKDDYDYSNYEEQLNNMAQSGSVDMEKYLSTFNEKINKMKAYRMAGVYTDEDIINTFKAEFEKNIIPDFASVILGTMNPVKGQVAPSVDKEGNFIGEVKPEQQALFNTASGLRDFFIDLTGSPYKKTSVSSGPRYDEKSGIKEFLPNFTGDNISVAELMSRNFKEEMEAFEPNSEEYQNLVVLRMLKQALLGKSKEEIMEDNEVSEAVYTWRLGDFVGSEDFNNLKTAIERMQNGGDFINEAISTAQDGNLIQSIADVSENLISLSEAYPQINESLGTFKEKLDGDISSLENLPGAILAVSNAAVYLDGVIKDMKKSYFSVKPPSPTHTPAPIPKEASGTLSFQGGLLNHSELGSELLIPASGYIDAMQYGSTVVPAQQAANIMKWGAIDPSTFKTPEISSNLIDNSLAQSINIESIQLTEVKKFDDFLPAMNSFLKRTVPVTRER